MPLLPVIKKGNDMTSRKNTVRAICAIFATLTCQTASAMTSCSGQVSKTYLGPDGDFNVQFGYGWTRICNMTGTQTVYRGAGNTSPVGISPAICTSFMAFFMTAQSARQTVTAIVDRTDCNMGDGVWANPYPAGFTSEP